MATEARLVAPRRRSWSQRCVASRRRQPGGSTHPTNRTRSRLTGATEMGQRAASRAAIKIKKPARRQDAPAVTSTVTPRGGAGLTVAKFSHITNLDEGGDTPRISYKLLW
jgi:hypothetical protein